MNEIIPKINPELFLKEVPGRVILDVRSPGEFEKGHIPGAHSFPLFTDEERARVGTLYSKAGHEAAFFSGLDIVGPKMSGFVKKALHLAPHRKVSIHCWRGGMRSASMAWLLQSAGFDVRLLDGGYKRYRAYIRERFNIPVKMLVLSGMSGCGKTEILQEVKKKGGQILDLEGLANHKGSVFGHVGQKPQPSTEQFENDLARIWSTFDFTKPLWVEDESRNIGLVHIPEPLFAAMNKAPVIKIGFPKEYRVKRLVDEYAAINDGEIASSLNKLKDTLGSKNVHDLLVLLSEKQYAAFADKILDYYDASYDYSLKRKSFLRIENISPKGLTPAEHAAEILEFGNCFK
ncbi:MAG: tRNA 2-selenouridine(34) synthase MnmH [Bacteroidota bacterium]|nr:tRNA 2-selenouridine(34) synthase MnmH [Bacteroidota bacterium]